MLWVGPLADRGSSRSKRSIVSKAIPWRDIGGSVKRVPANVDPHNSQRTYRWLTGTFDVACQLRFDQKPSRFRKWWSISETEKSVSPVSIRPDKPNSRMYSRVDEVSIMSRKSRHTPQQMARSFAFKYEKTWERSSGGRANGRERITGREKEREIYPGNWQEQRCAAWPVLLKSGGGGVRRGNKISREKHVWCVL